MNIHQIIKCTFWLLAVGFMSATAKAQAPEGMVTIPSGIYEPLYTSETDSAQKVDKFYMDKYPVTNKEFVEFVKRNPQWSRSRVKQIFADAGYLKQWKSDFVLEDGTEQQPVVNVSWFAAKAYCECKGKRLPTVAEWEYVGAASKTQAKGTEEEGYYEYILEWYSKPSKGPLPAVGSTFENFYGVYDMHGLVWEWTADFNNALVSGESRADSNLERNLFCGSGSVGSSDFKNYAAFMRFAFRGSLEGAYTVPNLGFRCAKDVNDKLEN